METVKVNKGLRFDKDLVDKVEKAHALLKSKLIKPGAKISLEDFYSHILELGFACYDEKVLKEKLLNPSTVS